MNWRGFLYHKQKQMNREQLNDALSEMRAKALKKTVPIVGSLALLVAGAL